MYKALADAIRDAEAQGISLSRLALETESRDQGRTVDDIRSVLLRALDVMRGAVNRGLTVDSMSPSGLVAGDPAKLRTGPAPRAAATTLTTVLPPSTPTQ